MSMMSILAHDKKNRGGIGFVLIPKMGSFKKVQIEPDILICHLVKTNEYFRNESARLVNTQY